MAPNPVRSKGRKRCPPAVTCERFAHRSTRSTEHDPALEAGKRFVGTICTRRPYLDAGTSATEWTSGHLLAMRGQILFRPDVLHPPCGSRLVEAADDVEIAVPIFASGASPGDNVVAVEGSSLVDYELPQLGHVLRSQVPPFVESPHLHVRARPVPSQRAPLHAGIGPSTPDPYRKSRLLQRGRSEGHLFHVVVAAGEREWVAGAPFVVAGVGFEPTTSGL